MDGEDVQEKIQAMMDVSKVNASLRAVQEEKESLDNKIKIELEARRELEGKRLLSVSVYTYMTDFKVHMY